MNAENILEVIVKVGSLINPGTIRKKLFDVSENLLNLVPRNMSLKIEGPGGNFGLRE